MRRYTIEERIAAFWVKVDTNGPIPDVRPDLGPCWLWQGSRNPDGYGQVRIYPRRMIKAHQFAYEVMIGALPTNGLELGHLCRVTNCVNPSHLEPVVHRVNVLRGDNFMARRARQTHCVNGHLFDQANTLAQSGGRKGRRCRTCKNLSEQCRRMRRKQSQTVA